MKQNTGRNLLSFLITLSMVIGLMPGMGLTAYAAPTETLLTTITATGKEQANYSTANVATVSFSYTAGGSSAYLANWGWWGYGWTATVNAAEGYTITKCVFYDDANRTATDSSSPFVVKTTEEDKTPQVNDTPILAYTSKGIKKIEVYGYATPAHTHSFTYAADGATITATCSDTSCALHSSPATLTLSAIDTTYTGSAYTGASLTDTTAWTGAGLTAPTIEYAGRGSTSYTKSTTAPTNAGTYTASITVDTDKTATATVNIGKADAQTIADVTDTLLYTATSVSESVAGKMPDDAGTLTYSAGIASKTGIVAVSNFDVNATSGAVTATLSGGAAGDTVTLPVTIGSTNYANSTVNVKITLTAKSDAGVDITGVPASKTYGDADFTLTGNVTNEGTGTGNWTWSTSDETVFQITPNGATATVKILKAGSATVTAKYESDTTIDTETTATITVNTKTLTITAKDQRIYVGGTVPTLSGSDFYTVTGLVEEDTLTTAPALAYQKDGSAATPDNTTTGTYDIVASGASAGDNYTIAYSKGTLTISEKQPATVTKAPETKTLTYNGSAQELVTAGIAEGGEMQYALGTATEATQPYTISIPTGTNTGTYYVWYKVVGDSDHSDTTPASISVTIATDPFPLNVEIHNYTNTGANGVPGDVPQTPLTLDIQIVDASGAEVSAVSGVPVDVMGGGSAKITKENVPFDRQVDLSGSTYKIAAKVSPSEVTSAPPISQVYHLSTDAWVGEGGVITIYLKWDDGKNSQPEVIRVYALPEDEIGAYHILPDGTKEYLLFHTYDICMAWLGSDELCRGPERCFHKSSPYENPFVTESGLIEEHVR